MAVGNSLCCLLIIWVRIICTVCRVPDRTTDSILSIVGACICVFYCQNSSRTMPYDHVYDVMNIQHHQAGMAILLHAKVAFLSLLEKSMACVRIYWNRMRDYK